MTDMNQAIAAPKLLKSRMRHTRLFALLLIPVMFISMGVLGDESVWHGVLEWLGYMLVIACVLGRAYCSAFIGGRKNDVVVDIGPFSIVRNPLYVFSFMGIVGIGLQSGMMSLLVLLVLVFLIYYPHVVKREEAYLRHLFGAKYDAYTARVPRWIPNFSLWHEPEEITTHPRFLRETMMDAALFFLAFPVFELIEDLHAAGLLPSYLLLP